MLYDSFLQWENNYWLGFEERYVTLRRTWPTNLNEKMLCAWGGAYMLTKHSNLQIKASVKVIGEECILAKFLSGT